MPIQTPICDFGQKAYDFKLKSTEGRILSLTDIKGEKGTLIMFICNHCPYVKAITKDIVEDCKKLKDIGINSVAICANDAENYPEDSFENMIEFSKKNQFGFPYLIDETQEIARTYDAVCTPDFFGFDRNLILKYRGRIDSGVMTSKQNNNIKRELFHAMIKIKDEGIAPTQQFNSIGCSIKWK